jgi:hypothetical protein
MAHAPRYGTFAANPNFPNGATLQSPPPGTIPRGQMPLHYQATPEELSRNKLIALVTISMQMHPLAAAACSSYFLTAPNRSTWGA